MNFKELLKNAFKIHKEGGVGEKPIAFDSECKIDRASVNNAKTEAMLDQLGIQNNIEPNPVEGHRKRCYVCCECSYEFKTMGDDEDDINGAIECPRCGLTDTMEVPFLQREGGKRRDRSNRRRHNRIRL